MDVKGMYWEIYDDQQAEDFDYVGYTNLSGEAVVTEISDNLALQVAEILRANGHNTEVRVYRK